MNLLDRMNENVNQVRNERITSFAQVSMAKSKLPPRMRKHEKREVLNNFSKKINFLINRKPEN